MADSAPILQIQQLTVTAGARTLVREATLTIPTKKVFGFIGPSGAGKSTLLKSINRLVELTPNLRVIGQILFHGKPVYGSGTDPDALRARIGILFQQPVVFPKSIYQNVIFGVKHLGEIPRREWPEAAERALRETALWNEVKDRLKQPALRLSVGQQQRLCLARALASKPEVVLMDEPTSALDPKSTEAIEELMLRLREHHTLVVVTHNIRQARKVADELAFVGVREGVGQVLCSGTAEEVLGSTNVSELEDFLCCQ
ncbi:ATP-binding cassette domain-containing protein [Roseimicrobium sp. ORNL1]|uniref:phosphate ABC transporter ATP-binding protein n=1 Tax=Roseimicrobium sp. ORNL1 TaxID=2711231 RepID=UPI0013E174EC|nr:ATP-binding cassette domain-containing protein [Roseimicrobium sp. ORNL1]QIF01319.1 ATP-binding cassette domain-containing protein [Roseimicrobium sp. ORNL1]